MALPRPGNRPGVEARLTATSLLEPGRISRSHSKDEVDDYIARFVAERDENGRRLVVRNGSREPREVLISAGAVRR